MTEVTLNKYHTFSQRLGAAIIDGILFIPVIYFGSKLFEPHADKSLSWLFLHNGIYLMYSIIGHHKFGQTIGKRLTDVKVVNIKDEAQLLTLEQAIYRDIIAIFFVFIEAYAISSNNLNNEYRESLLAASSLIWLMAEFITMLFNKKRRSIHDLIANSVCIDLTKKTEWEKKYGS